MANAARLDAALKAAGLQIVGVSCGEVVTVTPEAMQHLAQPIIDSYKEPSPAQVLEEAAHRDINERKLQAVVLALWECIPSPTMTKAQLKARAIALYKAL